MTTTIDTTPDTRQDVCTLGCTDTAPEHGREVCARCADELCALLREITELYALLDDAMLPGATTETGQRGAPGFGSRSPARDGVLALTDRRTRAVQDDDPHSVLEVLGSWADNVRDELNLPPGELAGTERREAGTAAGLLRAISGRSWAAPFSGEARHLRGQIAELLGQHRTVTGETAFLTQHLGHITGRYWVSDFADELGELRHQLRVAVGLATRGTPVGHCPAPVVDADTSETGTCGALLRARASAEHITCRACGASWPRERWDELANTLGSPACDLESLSVWLAVPNGTLRRWKLEDRWRNHGTRRRPLFARADVLASWRKRRTAA